MSIIPTRKNPTSLINVFCTFCGHSFFFLRSRINPAPEILPVTRCSLFILAFALFPTANGWAWEVNTHEDLTKQAIGIMEGDLNTYLIDNLGLEGGLSASVEGGTPRELMIQGSNTEDNFPRFLNHFHNPISNAGLTGSGESAIKWSLRPKEAQWFGEFWSWNDAREYYFKALTSATKTERDENWGKTFRALGQVMHLLQDSANPSHVRDDLHAFDDGLHDFMERRSVGSYIGGGIFSPDPSMLEQGGATRSEPFSNLFDRNIYSGANPQATLGTDIGVTEYTNANFFSDDTIPGQGSAFSTEITYPTVTELVPAPVPSPYLTLPRLGSAVFPGARAAKLTGNQAVAKFLLTNTNLDLLGQLQLDDGVYDAQAQNLIPRAVGYSAAVLDYFFRGELDVIRHEFEVLGVFDQTGCTMAPDPALDTGALNVTFTIPSNLNFVGTVSLYYDLPDETRVLGSQYSSPHLSPDGLSQAILHAEIGIDNPVRWYVVLEGNSGPGATEDRAILAKTDIEAWKYVCVY